MFKLGDVFKKAVTTGAGWLGNKLGGPVGGSIAKKLTTSLFDRQGSGGNWQITDTSVPTQNYGGKLGFDRASMAGKGDRMARTSDGEELRNEWDYRLTKWYRNKDQMFT
jgi:hypothetical protein